MTNAARVWWCVALPTCLSAVPAAAQFRTLPAQPLPRAQRAPIAWFADFGQSIGDDGLGRAFAGGVGFRVDSLAIALRGGIWNPRRAGVEAHPAADIVAAYRVYGGTFRPANVEALAGAGVTWVDGDWELNLPLGIGVTWRLPTPIVAVGPWVAGRVHYRTYGSGPAGVDSGVFPGVSAGVSITHHSGPGARFGLDYLGGEWGWGIGLHYAR